jgi:hypothetical protein
MNLSEDETADLSELTQAYHEGSLTPPQAERLEALILRNPEACAEFVQRSAIVTDLQWQLGAVNANAFPLRPPGVECDTSDNLSDEPNAAPLPVDAAGQSDAHCLAGGLPSTPAAGHSLSQNIKQHPLLYLAAGLVLATSLWSASGLFVSNRGNPEVIGSNIPALTRSVARLTRTMDAQWGVGTINDGAFLRSGQRLELVAGLAEVTYKNGAVVLLEAPVSFLLNDRDAEYQTNRALKNCDGYLESGRISVRVSKSSNGFAVQTVAAAITDMGAEFGLAVSNNDDVSLVVFSGSVEMAIADKYGDWRQRVDSGNSLRFDPSEISPLPQSVEEAGPFVRKLPEEQPPLLLHWDFNTAADDGRLVLDRSGQGRHGRFVGDAGKVQLTPGVRGFGQALALNGVEEFVELAEPQWSRLDDSFDEFTVALWLKPAEQHALEKMICGKMGFKYRRGWQLSLTTDNKPRFVFFRTPSDRTPIELVAEKALPIGEFSHLAMTFKGLEAARLYINGELCGTLNGVPMRMNGANRVNLQAGNRGDGYSGRYFEGMIDDFRIYRVALTGTMLRRLMNEGASPILERTLDGSIKGSSSPN